MTATSLDDFSRTVLNEAVNDGWLNGLPAEMLGDWKYVATLPGERGVERGRARLILQRKHDLALYALFFYESVGEMDLYQDRFRGEDIQFIRVTPYKRVIEYVDYKPLTRESYPPTEPISVHVHPHID
jgi:hypothetical protein